MYNLIFKGDKSNAVVSNKTMVELALYIKDNKLDAKQYWTVPATK